jgi:hypothetical protein
MISSSGNDTSSRPSHMRPFNKSQLSTLVDMETPEEVHKEVIHILSLISPPLDRETIQRVFRFTVDLYEGQLQEYKACNTDYHNLRHITDTYLAMARLLHGAQLSSEDFKQREFVLGLTGALMHDAGMIQESRDSEGTGAKYTQDHVKLSMDFVTKHAATIILSEQEIKDLQDMILCTDLMADIPSINFSSPKIELLGKMLGTADLIAQMADRSYLEKLLFLYHEFREAEMGNFKNEVDFLHQTLKFFEISEKRFKEALDNASRYMVPHFKSRWDIDENLYLLSLQNQRNFLEKVLAEKNISVYEELKRDNIVQKVRQKFGNTGLGEK